MARYCALFSGSKGNSTFVGTASGGILVDVGVSAKRIKEALEMRDITPDRIQGVCITHEHSDHVSGLRVLLKQFGWPVYASKGTLSALLDMNMIPVGTDLIPLENAPVTIGDIQMTPFHTPHDASESMGFCFEMPDERRIGVATDMGYMDKKVEQMLSGCDLVHIESNHDVLMLKNGSYPFYLKERILSDKGHLSNAVCAETVVKLARSGVTRFTLAHLSEENNTTDRAVNTSHTALNAAGMQPGRDYLLDAAPPASQKGITLF
jgi:phosphoribosyl 1,2-cyclic phosphodiesterase